MKNVLLSALQSQWHFDFHDWNCHNVQEAQVSYSVVNQHNCIFNERQIRTKKCTQNYKINKSQLNILKSEYTRAEVAFDVETEFRPSLCTIFTKCKIYANRITCLLGIKLADEFIKINFILKFLRKTKNWMK